MKEHAPGLEVSALGNALELIFTVDLCKTQSRRVRRPAMIASSSPISAS
ncbi:hypothetical protein IOD13_09200 [Brevibacterium casei]|nr:hypothetical protein [Brevibacterium casei]